jgi:hypothetical protein
VFKFLKSAAWKAKQLDKKFGEKKYVIDNNNNNNSMIRNLRLNPISAT